MKKFTYLIIILIFTNLLFFITTFFLFNSRGYLETKRADQNVNTEENVNSKKDILPEGPTLSQVISDQEIHNMIANWKTFKNERDGYEIHYPPDWVKEGPFDNLTGTISGSSSVTQLNFIENYDPILFPFGYSSNSLTVQIFSLDSNRTLESIAFEDEDLRGEKESISSFNYPSIDNKKAIQYYIDGQNAPEPYYLMDILIRKEDKIYEIEAFAKDKQEYGEYRGIFEAMVSTFKFL